jgi:hypothetical protein
MAAGFEGAEVAFDGVFGGTQLTFDDVEFASALVVVCSGACGERLDGLTAQASSRPHSRLILGG